MALPSSGPLKASQINLELGKASTAFFSLGAADTRNLAEVPSGPISFSDLFGKSGVIRKTITASANNVILQNYFTAAEWTSNTPKEVVVNAGVIVGSTTPATAAMRTGSGWGGTLTLINNGSIRGAGGQPNSGAGGHALESAGPLIVDNNGDIRGGGGAGGKGGTGGTGGGGYYTTSTAVREPASGNAYQLYYTMFSHDVGARGTSVNWGSTSALYNNPNLFTAAVTVGAYTYYRGAQRQAIPGPTGQPVGIAYDVYRTYNVSSNVNTDGGAGGAGGNGGRGQGSDAGATAGSAGAGGAPGGANAGAGGQGGTGGTGGTWGAPGGTGATGNTGAGGNRTGGSAGAAGAAGGAAGRAVSYISGGSVSWLATGTRSGAY